LMTPFQFHRDILPTSYGQDYPPPSPLLFALVFVQHLWLPYVLVISYVARFPASLPQLVHGSLLVWTALYVILDGYLLLESSLPWSILSVLLILLISFGTFVLCLPSVAPYAVLLSPSLVAEGELPGKHWFIQIIKSTTWLQFCTALQFCFLPARLGLLHLQC
jgi:hypothetical protein